MRRNQWQGPLLPGTRAPRAAAAPWPWRDRTSLAAGVGLLVGSLVVLAPALHYAVSPPRVEWGSLPEVVLTFPAVLVVLLAGTLTHVAANGPRAAAFAAGVLSSAFVGSVAAMTILLS